MVKVKIRFLSPLKEILKLRKEEIELEFREHVTLGYVVKTLLNQYKSLEKFIRIKNNDEIISYLNFFINGRSITSLHYFKTELEDGDSVLVVPVYAGG